MTTIGVHRGRLPSRLRDAAGAVLADAFAADTARYVDGLVREDAYLWVLGVTRDRHGRGVGRALVEAVRADAAAAGHRRLVLVTHDPGNVARYEAMGFVPLGRSVRASGISLHALACPTA